MRYRYLDDFRRGISVFAIFSYGIAVLGTPQCPPPVPAFGWAPVISLSDALPQGEALSTQSYCEAQTILKPCFEPFSSFPFCDNALLVKRAVMCCGRRLRRFLKRVFSAEKLSGEINSMCRLSD